MQIKLVYKDGVFKPKRKVIGFKNGDEFELADIQAIAAAGGSFDFLKDEEDLYTEDDVVEPA